MYISSVQSLGATAPPAGRSGRHHSPSRAGSAESAADRMEISGSARELAHRYSTQGLTAERIGVLRQQINDGTYPEPMVLEELAWRLIEAGVV